MKVTQAKPVVDYFKTKEFGCDVSKFWDAIIPQEKINNAFAAAVLETAAKLVRSGDLKPPISVYWDGDEAVRITCKAVDHLPAEVVELNVSDFANLRRSG